MNTVGKITIIGLLSAMISSCSSGTTASAGPLTIAGTWVGAFLSEVLSTDVMVNPTGVPRISAQVTLTINQDENNKLTGIANISDPETSCFSGGPFEGEITGSNYNIVITDGFGATITLTGEATINTMRGVYSTTAGGGGRCPAHTGEANFDKS